MPGLCNAVDGRTVFTAKMRIDWIRVGKCKKIWMKKIRRVNYRKTRMALDIELLLLNTT